MPKPALHHFHMTAGAPIEFLIKLTYYDHVYFNDRVGMFKVSKKGVTDDGYVKVNTLRKHWKSADEFDNYLKERILLTRKMCHNNESQVIWDSF